MLTAYLDCHLYSFAHNKILCTRHSHISSVRHQKMPSEYVSTTALVIGCYFASSHTPAQRMF